MNSHLMSSSNKNDAKNHNFSNVSRSYLPSNISHQTKSPNCDNSNEKVSEHVRTHQTRFVNNR